MKRSIFLLTASAIAATLAGCSPSTSTNPAEQASAVASSKPNPWTLDSKLPPSGAASASASASPAAKPSGSEAAKPNPFGLSVPTDPNGPTVSGKSAAPVN